MSRITRHNYEEIFIDYFDGNLNNHEIAELMLFLAQNTDLDTEFNDFEFVELNEYSVKFDTKDSLKKQDLTITGSHFHDKCIGKIENNLSSEKLRVFELELNTNQEKREEFYKFKQTIISPDLNIVLSNKKRLKKSENVIFKLKNIYQYAAVIVAILVTFTLLQEKTQGVNTLFSTDKLSSVEKFSGLSSFDKYDNQLAFTVVKKETPSIVSKSNSVETKYEVKPIYINRRKIEVINNANEIADNIDDEYLVASPIKISTINEERSSKIINNVELEPSSNVQADVDCNPSEINTLTNEINSDIYIDKMMSKYKNADNSYIADNDNSTKSVWELLGESISIVTGSKIEKTYSKDGRVSRLAINSNRFRVSKKIRK